MSFALRVSARSLAFLMGYELDKRINVSKIANNSSTMGNNSTAAGFNSRLITVLAACA